MPLSRNVAKFESYIEPSAVSAGAGTSIDIQVGYGGSYQNTSAPISVNGAAGSVNVRVAEYAYTNMDVSAASFGNIRVRFGAESSGNVSAFATAGGVGNIDVTFTGAANSGAVQVRASGDVGNITLRSLGISGGFPSRIDVETSGNIGNIRMDVAGAYTEGQVSARAFGGDIGDIRARWHGASASGSAYASAFAALDGQGKARGGNIGDISIQAWGGSADPYVSLRADGAISGGVWRGGGSIGDISTSTTGHSAESDVRARAYSGGTIGDIDIRLFGRRIGSAEANVSASAWGGGGQVAEIGDIKVLVTPTESSDCSGEVRAEARNGGDIGNVTMRYTDRRSYSGALELRLLAEKAASGGGGNVGNITLSNLSFEGSSYVDVDAGASIGNINLEYGAGVHYGRTFVSGAADVGNIGVRFDSRNVAPEVVNEGSFRHTDLTLVMADGIGGSEVGRITIAGGSDGSFYRIWEAKASSVEGVDASKFVGRVAFNLNDVDQGTTIRASRGGSDIRGTEGADKITLGAGADIVRLDTIDGRASAADLILSFTVSGARLDKLDVVAGTLHGTLFTTSSAAAGEIANGTVLRIVQPAGGNISTEAGLVAASDSFAGVFSLAANAKATVVAAATADATKWYVYEVEETDGVAGDWDTAVLVAEVQASHGIANLTSDNFL